MACFAKYKKIGAVLLLGMVLLQSFSKAIIVGDYYLNTASYAARCENKAFVELHCNGQCLMAKKLKEVAEKEQKNPERKAESHNDFYIFKLNAYAVPVQTFYDNRQKEFQVLPERATVDRPHFVFKPPIG